MKIKNVASHVSLLLKRSQRQRSIQSFALNASYKVTSHLSPLLKWSQRQRSILSFALNASYNKKEGLI